MKGFTLVEILVAMVLLAGIGAASLSAFSSTTRIVRTDQNVAYNFARGSLEKMFEQVRQDTWDTGSLPLSLATPGPQNIASVVNGQTLTMAYEVNDTPSSSTAPPQDLNGDGIEDYRKVTMTVSW
jgi:prepilin-type N-terminal cleavage/methylation domain-containing protein